MNKVSTFTPNNKNKRKELLNIKYVLQKDDDTVKKYNSHHCAMT